MKQSAASRIPGLLKKHEQDVLAIWIKAQLAAVTQRPDLLKESDLREQSRKFLAEFQSAAQTGSLEDIGDDAWADAREMLGELSRSRAQAGFTPSETATFVFSLKQPLFGVLRSELKGDAEALAEETWRATVVLDKLGLYTTEIYQQNREEIIARQQRELLELSTPVVELWEDVLALP